MSPYLGAVPFCDDGVGGSRMRARPGQRMARQIADGPVRGRCAHQRSDRRSRRRRRRHPGASTQQLGLPRGRRPPSTATPTANSLTLGQRRRRAPRPSRPIRRPPPARCNAGEGVGDPHRRALPRSRPRPPRPHRTPSRRLPRRHPPSRRSPTPPNLRAKSLLKLPHPRRLCLPHPTSRPLSRWPCRASRWSTRSAGAVVQWPDFGPGVNYVVQLEQPDKTWKPLTVAIAPARDAVPGKKAARCPRRRRITRPRSRA